MTEEQFNSIVEWQNKTFTKATPLSCINHLEEEVKELKTDIEAGNFKNEELADCFLLLIGVCNKLSISFSDITKIIDLKMMVNYTRKWGDVNNLGYVKHVE